MSDKYLIDKASLTALADITRAYNETPDKEYSLAEVTEQVKKASENFNNLFTGSMQELNNERVTEIEAYAFSGALKNVDEGKIDLPNVTKIFKFALSNNKLRYVNMPKLESIGNNAFTYLTITASVYFPSLKTIGANAFEGFSKSGTTTANCLYFPALESFGTGAFNNSTSRIIIKGLPALEGLPNWGNARNVNILLRAEDYEKAISGEEANWGEITSYLKKATTYDSDYSKYWSNFITRGILTEKFVREDFYGEIVSEGSDA